MIEDDALSMVLLIANIKIILIPAACEKNVIIITTIGY